MRIPLALQYLANDIIAAARETGTRFGDRKVFLSTIGLDLGDPEELSLLNELRQLGAISLHRADFVSAMDPALIAASTVWLSGAEFHFISIA
jgi:hypothetical protein